MEIGYFDRFEPHDNFDDPRYGGEINLLGVVKGHFRLVAQAKRKASSPSHVLQILQNGDWYQAGSAWLDHPKNRATNKPDTSKAKYFSVSMELPGIGRHRFSVFEGDDNQQPEDWKKGDPCQRFNAVWSAPVSRAAAPAGGGDTGAMIGDSVNY